MQIEAIYGDKVVVNGKELTLEVALLAALASLYKKRTGRPMVINESLLDDVRGLMINYDKGNFILSPSSHEATETLMKDEVCEIENVEVDCSACDDGECLCRGVVDQGTACEIDGECYKDKVHPGLEDDGEIVEDKPFAYGSQDITNSILQGMYGHLMKLCPCGGKLVADGTGARCILCNEWYSVESGKVLDAEKIKLLCMLPANRKEC